MKLACIQMNSSDDMAENITVAEGLIRKAHEQGAQLMALPENAFFMRSADSQNIPERSMDSHEGLAAMKSLARELQCHILIGSLFVRDAISGKDFNRSVLVSPEGAVQAYYDKIHLFDADFKDGECYRESANIAAGDKAVITSLPCGNLGMSICYDLRFAHLYRDLAKAGATILAVPAAFTERTGKAHWHVLLRARAIETGCYVIAPAQCGTHGGKRRTYGHSLIIDPWGEVMADGGDEVGVVMAEIDPDTVARARNHLPCLQHDRDYLTATIR